VIGICEQEMRFSMGECTERKVRLTFVNVRFLLVKSLRKFLVGVSLDTQRLSNCEHLFAAHQVSHAFTERLHESRDEP